MIEVFTAPATDPAEYVNEDTESCSWSAMMEFLVGSKRARSAPQGARRAEANDRRDPKQSDSGQASSKSDPMAGP